MLNLIMLFIALLLWFIWRQLEHIAICLFAIYKEAQARRLSQEK